MGFCTDWSNTRFPLHLLAAVKCEKGHHKSHEILKTTFSCPFTYKYTYMFYQLSLRYDLCVLHLAGVVVVVAAVLTFLIFYCTFHKLRLLNLICLTLKRVLLVTNYSECVSGECFGECSALIESQINILDLVVTRLDLTKLITYFFWLNWLWSNVLWKKILQKMFKNFLTLCNRWNNLRRILLLLLKTFHEELFISCQKRCGWARSETFLIVVRKSTYLQIDAVQ